jgi:hypothetical protein
MNVHQDEIIAQLIVSSGCNKTYVHALDRSLFNFGPVILKAF